MGRRSAIEATVGILGAFLRRRTWQQAELARELELEPRAIRRHLNELTRRRFPLEREDDPPHVYWSMPKDWFPGGILLEASDTQLLIQLLCRTPTSKPRDTLLRRLTSAVPDQARPVAQLASVFHGVGEEPPFLALVSDAALSHVALHARYFSASRGALEWRHVSVQRVLPGPPARMVVHCHRSRSLKWFRVDGIAEARLDPAIPYHHTPAAEVDTYLSTSLDGFAAEDTAIEHRFFVADPDARWVSKNLIAPMRAEVVSGGVRVTCRTTATLRLARHVLSLAPVARAETPELEQAVKALAEATLTGYQRAKPLRRSTKNLATSPRAASEGRSAGAKARAEATK